VINKLNKYADEISTSQSCKLCGKREKLLDSHIIPEFFFKPLYDKCHRYLVIPSSPGKRIDVRQKGIREKILCSSCEQLIGSFENYAKELIFGSKRLNIRVLEKTSSYFVCNGVDYKKFKLFQLSILWRAGVSQHPLFSIVQLGPHENKIRKMILESNPGEPYQYGCLMSALRVDDELMDIICPPCKLYVEGQRCYRCVFGGFYWVFFVSNHSDCFLRKDLFLSKEGVHFIFAEEASEVEFLKRDANRLRKRGKDVLTLISKLRGFGK
jgi:hypothetical protein